MNVQPSLGACSVSGTVLGCRATEFLKPGACLPRTYCLWPYFTTFRKSSFQSLLIGLFVPCWIGALVCKTKGLEAARRLKLLMWALGGVWPWAH